MKMARANGWTKFSETLVSPGNQDRVSGTNQIKPGQRLHPDEQLVRRCLKGDTAGQRMLYEQYRIPMFRVCLRYTSCREDAEDFLQDGFVRVFRDLHQYRNDGPLGAWMRKIMVNTILQQFRKKRLEFESLDSTGTEPVYDGRHEITARLDAELLNQLVQQLPDGYRIVFNLYAIEGFTHQEIAQELGINIGTSKSQLWKARAMLKTKLEHVLATEKV